MTTNGDWGDKLMEWPRDKVITEAEKEPERLKFWQQYYEDYYEACLAVVETPPSFDRIYAREFPDPSKFKAIRQGLDSAG